MLCAQTLIKGSFFPRYVIVIEIKSTVGSILKCAKFLCSPTNDSYNTFKLQFIVVAISFHDIVTLHQSMVIAMNIIILAGCF